ncbi:MAG: glycosyltransferase family 39 protein [Actinomycetes bacterium]
MPQAGTVPPPTPWRWLLAIAAAPAVLLLAVSGRYGYHRDELYFIAAGHHLAWGYPDQPPFVPFLARLMTAVAPGSLPVLRTPSAIAMALVVVLAALTARELGAGGSGQLLAAGAMAVSAFLLGAGHLLSTSTFALLAWSSLVWLVIRILRTGNQRLWLVAGVVAGVGLLDSDLTAFLMAGVVAGMLITGPRSAFRSPWIWIGGVIAAAMWTPYLIWQARHGWPQLDVSKSIAAGNSGTSEPRWSFIPFQFGLVSPWLAPVWITGLVRLFRDNGLRWARAIGWAYALMVVAFIAKGGKPYYVAGMFPVLLGAGAQPAIDWVRRGLPRRRRLLIAAIVLSTTPVLFTVPVLPLSVLPHTPVVAINYDIGETVAWPAYVEQIARVYADVPGAAILTSNYGEAGAVDRYGGAFHLPHAFSGHNGFYYWGPPPDSVTTVVTVGIDKALLMRSFSDVRLAAQLHNARGIDNDEQGVHVYVCTQPKASWRTLWPRFRNIG